MNDSFNQPVPDINLCPSVDIHNHLHNTQYKIKDGPATVKVVPGIRGINMRGDAAYKMYKRAGQGPVGARGTGCTAHHATLARLLLDAVVKQSGHSADEPDVLGPIPSLITAGNPAVTRA